MRKPFVILLFLVLTGCSSQSANVEIERQHPSWQKQKIMEFGYEEKNLDLSMEEMIAKQKACEDYANEKVGEAGYNSEWQETHEHRYSPRFDKCFSQRTSTSDSRGIQFIIYDALSSGGPVITSFSWCTFTYNEESELTYEQQQQDRCPNGSDIDWIWRELIGTSL